MLCGDNNSDDAADGDGMGKVDGSNDKTRQRGRGDEAIQHIRRMQERHYKRRQDSRRTPGTAMAVEKRVMVLMRTMMMDDYRRPNGHCHR